MRLTNKRIIEIKRFITNPNTKTLDKDFVRHSKYIGNLITSEYDRFKKAKELATEEMKANYTIG